MENLVTLLERNANKYPDDIGVIYPKDKCSLTWQEIDRRSALLASDFKAKGLQPGEKVGIFLNNTPDFLIAYFAILKVGATVVPVNVKLTSSEVEYILNNAEVSGLVFADFLAEQVENLKENCTLKFWLATKELPGIYNQEAINVGKFADPGKFPAEILYTSGTTGKPKGVVLTHQAVYSAGMMYMYEMDIYYRDKVLILMPLTHSAPLNLTMIGAVMAGAALVLGDYHPVEFLELAQNEKIDHFFGAPVAYLMALSQPNFRQYRMPQAKSWCYGGAPLDKAKVELILNNFPGRVMSVYGLTEAGPNGMSLRYEEHEKHAGSIGKRGTLNCEVKLVNEEGQEVRSGEPGEIVLRGPSLMTGYYQNPEATLQTLKNGWLYTGDIAYRDEEGYLYILDRKKDMIITGGVNVYPKEVEDVISKIPSVAEVAVFGLPHPEWGETVCAAIELRPGTNLSEEEILAYCAKELARYKVPKKIFLGGAIPRNPSGKILKKILREMYQL